MPPVLRYLDVGRVAGIPIRLHLSWFAAVPLFTFASIDLWAPGATGLAAAALSLAFSLAFFGSVLAHELAHALVARVLGVHTADVSLYVFGGAARITSEPADPGGEVLMAAAGPLGSVLLASLAGLAAQLLDGWAGQLAWLLAAGNLTLAMFNLLPGFPLDGGRIARAAVWRWTGRRVLATRVTAWIGRGLAVLLAGGGATATFLAHAPRYLIQVALGLVLYRASVEGERAARGAAAADARD